MIPKSKKRTIGDALKSSVAAEDDAVRQRFEQADRILLEPKAESRRVPETPEPARSERSGTLAGVTRLAYSLPPDEAAKVEAMLLRAAQSGHLVNRSELVRAALLVLDAMPDDAFEKAVMAVAKLKPGRPVGS